MFWRVYEVYHLSFRSNELFNQSNDEGEPSERLLLGTLYQGRIAIAKLRRLFAPLHPDEAEGLKVMRCLNAGTISRAGDVNVPHTWLRDQQTQVAPAVANDLDRSQQRALELRLLVSWRKEFQGWMSSRD